MRAHPGGIRGWQFLTTHGPRKAYGSPCGDGRQARFKPAGQGYYEATLEQLTACQKRVLRGQVAQERHHELKLRYFFLTISARTTRGEIRGCAARANGPTASTRVGRHRPVTFVAVRCTSRAQARCAPDLWVAIGPKVGSVEGGRVGV